MSEIPKYFFSDRKKKKSQKQEDRVAAKIGGKRQIASGAFPHHRGDVRSPELLVECKRTDKKSISIKVEYLEKISREASGYGCVPAVSISFGCISSGFDDSPGLVDKDWILIPASFVSELIGDHGDGE